jgi:ankyrin repeat protein
MNYLGAGGLKVHADDGVSQSSAALDPLKYRDPLGDKAQETDGYNYQESKLRYPFLEYAVGNWAFHASNYDFEDDEFYTSMANFLDPDSLDFKKWLKLEWMKGVESSKIEAPTPLHIAAFAGLSMYAKKLLEEKVPVDPRDAEDRTPLHWACARGHTSMASLLLNNGASADPEDIRGVKPIHEAARRNHAAIVNVLLEAGVHPLTPKTKENVKRRLICGDVSTKGETAVEYAWLQGHTDTIATMLPFLTPETLEELFCQCCRYGKFEAVRAILKATDVSPNSKYSGATALYLACRAQSVGIVELLLAKGADVHQTSEWEITNRNACGAQVRQEPLRLPIHGVVMGWKRTNNIACQQILRLLLNAGADIEAKDTHGDTTVWRSQRPQARICCRQRHCTGWGKCVGSRQRRQFGASSMSPNDKRRQNTKTTLRIWGTCRCSWQGWRHSSAYSNDVHLSQRKGFLPGRCYQSSFGYGDAL